LITLYPAAGQTLTLYFLFSFKQVNFPVDPVIIENGLIKNGCTSSIIFLLFWHFQAVTAKSLLYSQWMASSNVSRSQGILTGQVGALDLLQAGFVQKAFHRLVDQYPDHNTMKNFSLYIKSGVGSIIPLLENATGDISYPLDRLSNGNNLISLYKKTGNSTYSSILEALRYSIDLQPRNQAGGL
jgi:hypothetical protein